MNKLKLYTLLILLNLLTVKTFADDPFTRSLAEPEPVVETEPEPKVEEQAQQQETEQETQQTALANEEEMQGDIENIENLLKAPEEVGFAQTPSTPQTETPVETQVVSTPIKEKVPVPKTSRDEYVSKIVNIDPISGHDIERYRLKGVAVSRIYNFDKKRRVNNSNKHLSPRKKIDFGNIPKTHIVMKDQTIDDIAKKYGFTKEEFEIANALIPGKNTILPGNRLVIPNRYHVIKEGETINIIAEYYDLDASEVAAFNNLEIEEEIKIDQKLLLPFYLHITEEKQTIEEIAKLYRRTVDEVLKANNLDETALIDVDQYVKIPIHVNNHGSYQNLNVKSVLDYSINPKNLAIVEIDSAQFMVREGDTLGNKDGKIVKIKSNEMMVIQDGREYLFKINAPLVGSTVASAPAAPTPTTPAVPGETPQTGDMPATNQTTDQPGQQENPPTEQAAETSGTETGEVGSNDVEDLFR